MSSDETAAPDDLVETCAREAFWSDDIGGHHKPGARPHTWENIPEVGRENYRTLVRAILAAALPVLRRHIADENEATCAELRRQLAGTGALLGEAETEVKRLRDELHSVNRTGHHLDVGVCRLCRVGAVGTPDE